jgi:hypothetical protein
MPEAFQVSQVHLRGNGYYRWSLHLDYMLVVRFVIFTHAIF